MAPRGARVWMESLVHTSHHLALCSKTAGRQALDRTLKGVIWWSVETPSGLIRDCTVPPETFHPESSLGGSASILNVSWTYR